MFNRVLYINPDLLIQNLDANFYYITNLRLNYSSKIITKEQYEILKRIDGHNTIPMISEELGIDEEKVAKVIDILHKNEYVNWQNKFQIQNFQINPQSMNLWIHTTNTCTLRCDYCIIETLGKNTIMSKSTFEQLARSIIYTVKKRGLKKVVLRMAGGEPLTAFENWKHFYFDLKKELEVYNCMLRIGIITNLTILNDEIIDFICYTKSFIGVSIDGMDNFNLARHFKNGENSYYIVKKNLYKLISKGIKPNILIVVSDINVDGLLELTKWIMSLDLHFRYSIVQGQNVNYKKIDDVLEQCYSYMEEQIKSGFKFSSKHKLYNLKTDKGFYQACTCGFSSGAIYTDGQIYFCHTNFGRKDSLGLLDDNTDIISILQTGSIELNEQCLNCVYKLKCGGGCPISQSKELCQIYKKYIPILYRLSGLEKLFYIKNDLNENIELLPNK